MGIEDGGRQASAGPTDMGPSLRQRAEEQAREAGSKGLEAHSPEETGRLHRELHARQIELERQNEELRRTQEMLTASRARYSELYDLAPVGYFSISEKGLILEANLTAATMLGVPRDALAGQPIARSIIPEDQDIYSEIHKQLFETDAPQVCELRMVRQGARVSQFWARLESIVVHHEASGTLVFRIAMSDITERKQAERAAERLAHDLGERVKELNCLHDISNLVEIPGISLEEILQRTVDLVRSGWQYPEVACARILLEGQEYRTGNFVQCPRQQSADILVDGEPRGVVQVGYLQEMPDGDDGPFLKEEAGLLNSIAKRLGRIAERLRAQQQVLQQRHFLQTVLDSLAHPFYVINVHDHTLELANSAMERSRTESTCFGFLHGYDQPCDRADHPCPLNEVVRTKRPVVVEHLHMDEVGRQRAVEVHAFPIADEEDNVIQVIEYVLDITDRKEVERALRDSEAKLRILFEILPVGISILDESRNIRLANPALARILQLGEDHLHRGDYQKRTYLRANGTEVPPGELPSNRAFQEQRLIRDVEIGILKEDDELIWTSVSAVPLVAGDWRVIVATSDITRQKRTEAALVQTRNELEVRVKERTTELEELNRLLRSEIAERRQAEEDLRSSEERFRQLAEHINHVFWITDLADNRLLYVSPAVEGLWGQARQTLYEQPTSFLDAVHPEDRHRVTAALGRASRKEQSEQFRVVRPDGTLLWVRGRVFPVRDEQGRVYRLAGIADDISEQIESLQLLERRVEERTRQLSTLLKIAHSMTLTLEVGPLLEMILDGLDDVTAYDSATIYELKGEQLVALAHRGRTLSEKEDLRGIPLAESPVAQRIITDQAPLLISDTQGRTDDGLLVPLSDWARSGMATPLGARQKVMGLLVVYSSHPQAYSWQQTGLFLAFANQTAVGIENARLYEQTHELAVLEERQRLARDLHDAVSQTLFSANIIAETLPRIWDRDPESVRRRLPQLHQLTSGALAEMRTLLLELRPTALVDVEFGDLLQLAADAFSGRTRTELSLELVGQGRLPPQVQVALYRIAQEALNNVAKHARAAEATILLHNEPDRVELRIRDNGQGFDPNRISPGCMGLTILRERAMAIEATVEVSSELGEGTEIVVVWTDTP